MIKKKIKITFILPSLAGGGAQKVILNILKAINKSRFDPELIVFNKSGPLVGLIPPYVKVINLKKKRLRNSIIPLIKYFFLKKPKIIFSTLGHDNLFLIAIRFILPRETKIIIREANTLTSNIKLMKYSSLMELMYKIFYKKSDKIIALSKAMAEELKKEFKVLPKNIKIIYNPVDLKDIRSNIKKIKRFKLNKICYISAGRLVKQKGFDRLILAISKLSNNSHLTIMGEGPELVNLKKIVKENNLVSKVSFIGFQKNPWEWYAGADIMLVSSYWEGLPNSVIEALACGCKIISVDGLGGVKDIKSLSSKNKVKIKSFPDNFLEELKKVKKKNFNKLPNKSFLPKEFNIENSVKKLEKLFLSVIN